MKPSHTSIFQLIASNIDNWLPLHQIDEWKAGTHQQCSINVSPVAWYFFATILVTKVVPAQSLIIEIPAYIEGREWNATWQAAGLDSYYFPPWSESQTISADHIAMERSVAATYIARSNVAVITPHGDNSINSRALAERIVNLRVGQKASVATIRQRLLQGGYQRVPNSRMHGEFSARGEIVDIYPPLSSKAWRLQFDIDTIESIAEYDPATQRTMPNNLQWLIIPPCSESDQLQTYAPGPNKEQGEQRELQEIAAGESITALFENNSILLKKNSQVLTNSAAKLKNISQDVAHNQTNTRNLKKDSQVLAPATAILKKDSQVFANLKKSSQVKPSASSSAIKPTVESVIRPIIDIECLQPPNFYSNHALIQQEITRLHEQGYQVYWLTPNTTPTSQSYSHCHTLASPFQFHLYLTSALVAFLGPTTRQNTTQRQKATRYPSHSIYSHSQIDTGDYVVHNKYGIGRYEGLQRMCVNNSQRDYLRICYAKDEIIFLPIEQINLINKYIGLSGNPRLDSLKSKGWERRRGEVTRHTHELATHLLRLYASRSIQKGYSFPAADEWIAIINQNCPFTLTPSQVRGIDEVMSDMESEAPMDRLICGDVGFGKTEVAIYATCRALHANKQVVLLAPTTILAEQHWHTFRERFVNLPVRIEHLSRLVPKSEQQKIIEGLHNHTVDMIIGTHRLLQADILFQDLGLYIIDEEQRFGVKDKEKIKSLRSSIDLISMTATPIPRTLHLSLSQLRDISLIDDPPQDRKPVHTAVREYNIDAAVHAVTREIKRGGQVFWLHNTIETIGDIANTLSELLPAARIAGVHGSLAPAELDSVMYDFIHHNYDVLITTTIIENGIDIPNVNTLIIERGDLLGLSQLYQLRGRIGRSARQAYALLLYPPHTRSNRKIQTRLNTIARNSNLGSGFNIALHDLELRGAGNILGKQQSGDIYSVGYEMYNRLLQQAVNALQSKAPNVPEPYLDLQYDAYIPHEYIENSLTRLEIYQKIAIVYSAQDITELHQEIEERFGAVPKIMQVLFTIAHIRVLCKKLHIISIKERTKIEVVLGKIALLNQERLNHYIANATVHVAPHSSHILYLNVNANNRYQSIIDILSELRPNL